MKINVLSVQVLVSLLIAIVSLVVISLRRSRRFPCVLLEYQDITQPTLPPDTLIGSQFGNSIGVSRNATRIITGDRMEHVYVYEKQQQQYHASFSILKQIRINDIDPLAEEAISAGYLCASISDDGGTMAYYAKFSSKKNVTTIIGSSSCRREIKPKLYTWRRRILKKSHFSKVACQLSASGTTLVVLLQTRNWTTPLDSEYVWELLTNERIDDEWREINNPARLESFTTYDFSLEGRPLAVSADGMRVAVALILEII